MNHQSLTRPLDTRRDQAAPFVAAATGLATCIVIVALSIRQLPLWWVGVLAVSCLAGVGYAFAKLMWSFSSKEAIADQAPALGDAFIVPIEPPAPPRNFMGRKDQLAAIHERFMLVSEESPAVVMITGAPGIGKTALAARYASRHRSYFPGGQLYVELGHVEPGRAAGNHLPVYEILGRFLLALLPAHAQPSRRLTARKARYRELTANKRTLVIIDNACHVDCVRPLLPDTLKSAVILISRRDLDGLSGAFKIRLHQLSQDEGRRLLESTVGPDVVESHQAAGQLASAGNPLTIRLAATALARRAYRPLEQAVGESPDLTDVESSVEANLDLIYGLLAPEERKALRCVALLDQPEFATWELAALLGVKESEGARLADNLARVDLIHRTGGGQAGIVEFAVDENILPYLRERIPVGRQLEQFKVLQRARTARKNQQAEIELRLNHTVWEWKEAGLLVQAFEAARSAVAYAKENKHPHLEALALATIADLRLEIGNIAGAHDLAKSAARLVTSASGRARALRCLGSIKRREGHPEMAKDDLDQALAEARRVHDVAEEIRILMEQASVFAATGAQRRKSVTTADRAINLCREQEGVISLLPSALYARSKVLLSDGDPVGAKTGLDEALLAVTPNQPLVSAWIHELYGQVMLELKDPGAAITRSVDAIDIFGGMAHRYGIACSRLTLGLAYATAANDRLDEAVTAVSDALETLQNCDDPRVEARAKRTLAELLVRRGRICGDQADIHEAENLFEALGDVDGCQQLQAEFLLPFEASRKRLSGLSAGSRHRSI